ncbi:hypothetical protein ACFSQ7_05560 [Paenibacillus rhizoplanae]
MLLAEAAAQEPSKFHTFDAFMIVFTILILIGVVRLLRAPQKNKFAIGFWSGKPAGVCGLRLCNDCELVQLE